MLVCSLLIDLDSINMFHNKMLGIHIGTTEQVYVKGIEFQKYYLSTMNKVVFSGSLNLKDSFFKNPCLSSPL